MPEDARGHSSDDVAGERGYDGTKIPVKLEDIEHAAAPAVVVGALQQDGHIIRADGVDVLIVECRGAGDGSS